MFLSLSINKRHMYYNSTRISKKPLTIVVLQHVTPHLEKDFSITLKFRDQFKFLTSCLITRILAVYTNNAHTNILFCMIIF